jgi:GNAT superfamily N-acetyltransferase
MGTSDRQPDTPAVRLLEAAAGGDAGLVVRLAELVNDAYGTAERGLWREGWSRTTASQLSELIRAEQIAVAVRDGRIAGCVRVHAVAEDAGELGMLVSAPEERGTGVGRALVAFAEEHTRESGLRAIRLELLVPRDRPHPGKELLGAWYRRIGYRLTRTDGIEVSYPQLAPLLLTPCAIDTYEKLLA